MTQATDMNNLVVGLDIPAKPGMHIDQVSTPALIVDLDKFESNVETMRKFVSASGMRLRAHAKTHKSADIARYQMKHGGACGICCQKVSEAQALVAAGVSDVLVSNQVVDPGKLDHLARLAGDARVLVCVDDAGNINDLANAVARHGTTIECLVEIDCGAGRCGVPDSSAAVSLALKISHCDGLVFAGIQAYQGSAQHIRDYEGRRRKIESATAMVVETLEALRIEGLECAIVAGGGTGSYHFETGSGVYNELQCGSYIFMDTDYARILDQTGNRVSEFENSLFILTSIMSNAGNQKAVCDAGLKAFSVDSGLPEIYGRDDLKVVNCSDEHGEIDDPENSLALNQRLKLVPGHCDPTCNLHDWFVGVRGNLVECLWPVTARGKLM